MLRSAIVSLLLLTISVIACSTAPTPTSPVRSVPTSTLRAPTATSEVPLATVIIRPPTGTITAEPTATPTPDTFTPTPLPDPAGLRQVELTLKRGVEEKNVDLLMEIISISQWVGAVYRVGGTPPLDPMRGLRLTDAYLKENSIALDLDRPAIQPHWLVPVGDTAVVARVRAGDNTVSYAHFYLSKEPSAWRYVGILSKIPYYDSPNVAQLRANPGKYAEREITLTGEYRGKENPPAELGTAPDSEAFVLKTFAGDIWIVRKRADYASEIEATFSTKIGRTLRAFGVVKSADGKSYIEADSFYFLPDGIWSHVRGKVVSTAASARTVTIQPEQGSVNTIALTETTIVSRPDGTAANISDLATGTVIDATGAPSESGSLLTDAIFIAP